MLEAKAQDEAINDSGDGELFPLFVTIPSLLPVLEGIDHGQMY